MKDRTRTTTNGEWMTQDGMNGNNVDYARLYPPRLRRMSYESRIKDDELRTVH